MTPEVFERLTKNMQRFFKRDAFLVPTFSDYLLSADAGMGTLTGLFTDYRAWRAAKVKAARKRGLNPIYQPPCKEERKVKSARKRSRT